MDHDRWKRLERLFKRALDLAPDARGGFLDRECAGDDELRREVERLLSHDEGAAQRLAAPIAEAARTVTEPDARRETIGPYKVLRELGRGGMGTVYLGTRADDEYRMDVAIKVVPGVGDSRELLQRFRAERQILATLEHPNIARLLDGGATEDGLPYLVMEYVEGEPIDSYCDRNRLSVADRLRRFLDVCSAVQHAHRHLIVHRDLKPGNILVTSDGTPKLLDFGIAKLLDPSGASHSIAVTSAAQRLMTPEYASPEQVRGDAVGTFTDVYSLGVLLYEMLSGRRPYSVGSHRLGEIERAICEQEPERLSLAVTRPPAGGSARGATSEELSVKRGCRPETLRRLLAGDLDDIVMMALRKEPERRYPSVERMAHDIRRHLDGLPVSARPDTWGYRGGKFVRRHRWSLALATLAALMVVGFGVTMAVQAGRIASERDTAEQVTRFLVGMFEGADPETGIGADVTAGEIVGTASARIRTELADQPVVRERLLGTLGEVNHSLGALTTSIALLTERLELSRELYGDDSMETARALNQLGVAEWRFGQYDQAEPRLERAQEIYRERPGADVVERLDVMFNRAMLRFDTARAAEAEEILREAYRIATGSFTSPHASIARCLALLGSARAAQNDFDQAADYLRQAVQMNRALAGDDDLTVATSLHDLADALERKGDLAGAMDAAREALRIRRKRLPETHPAIGKTASTVGTFHWYLKEFDEAIELLQEAVRVERAVYAGRDHESLASSLSNLALALSDAGRWGESREAFDEALAMRRRLYGENHPDVAWTMNNIGWAMFQRKECAEAIPLFERAVAVLTDPKLLDPFASTPMKNLGVALACDGQIERAEQVLTRAIAYGREHMPKGHPHFGTQVAALGAFLMNAGRAEEAEPVLREALEIRIATLPADHPVIEQARSALAGCRSRIAGAGP